jgi:phenylacetate-CoA ligase
MLSLGETALMGMELLNAYRRQSMSKAALSAYRKKRLEALIKHAVTHSPFYRERLKGLESAPLADLPVTTKADLTANFDQAVTDPNLTALKAEKYLANLSMDDEFLEGEYRLCSTSGSTGARSILPFSRLEWVTFMTGIARTAKWAGVPTPILRPRRVASLTSTKPGFMSARTSNAMPSFLAKTLRIDPAMPLDTIVEKLNAFQPETLGGFTSLQRMLAEEQLAGRLKIRPSSILATSEPLTKETRRLIFDAYGHEPFNNYIAAEANLASDCDKHKLHVFSDWVILESVDAHNRPVPDGQPGQKVLLTVLWGRTLPLIRYELTDSIVMSGEACECGLPFETISSVDGRQADIMYMAGRNGRDCVIHPIVLVSAGLDFVRSQGWRVVQTPSGLDVIIAQPDPTLDLGALVNQIHAALDFHGVAPRNVEVRIVDAIPRTAGSKAPMFQALPRALAS